MIPAIGFQKFTIGMLTPLISLKILFYLGGVTIRQPTLLRLPRKMHLSRSSSNVPRPPSFWEMLENPHRLLTFDKVHNPVCRPRETTSERPKALRTRQFFCTFDLEMCFAPQPRALFEHLNVQSCSERVLNILAWKCASRHNGVHFFNMSTSKSGPNLVCFAHFDLEMCTARRALFRHLNFQKWSDVGVLCILAWRCAWRHNGKGVQLFIPPMTTGLRTRRFSEPTFRPSGATSHWKKTQSFATFLPFRAPASSFFSRFLFSDLLSSALLLSDYSHCFCICPYCRKFDF